MRSTGGSTGSSRSANRSGLRAPDPLPAGARCRGFKYAPTLGPRCGVVSAITSEPALPTSSSDTTAYSGLSACFPVWAEHMQHARGAGLLSFVGVCAFCCECDRNTRRMGVASSVFGTNVSACLPVLTVYEHAACMSGVVPVFRLVSVVGRL